MRGGVGPQREQDKKGAQQDTQSQAGLQRDHGYTPGQQGNMHRPGGGRTAQGSRGSSAVAQQVARQQQTEATRAVSHTPVARAARAVGRRAGF